MLIDDQQEISAWCSQQRGAVRIAVAFWGEGAIEHLGLDGACDVRILLDLSAGASNPKTVRRLLTMFPRSVRQLDRLHAKAWIGEQSVIIGSANASANGLGLEGSEATHWRELGLRTGDAAIVSNARAWFEALWEVHSQTISEQDLRTAEASWKRRRAGRPSQSQGRNLLDAASRFPSGFQDRRIFVVVANQTLSPAADIELARLNEAEAPEFFAYEAWPSIPKDATLIAFTNYDGVLEFDAPAMYATESKRRPGMLQIVHARELVLGLKPGPFKAWKTRLAVLRQRHPKMWNAGDLCIELTEFIALTHAG